MQSEINEFEAFVTQAVDLAGLKKIDSAGLEQLVNGVPYETFRNNVDLGVRRAAGTFFTSGIQAELVAKKLIPHLTPNATVMDPTCGIGDLLMAYTAYLPVYGTLRKTISMWGKVLQGVDKDKKLVNLAKARLIAMARLRGGFEEKLKDVEDTFPLIREGDFTKMSDKLMEPDGFLFNPPFGKVRTEQSRPWYSGSINTAALFLDHLVRQKRPEVAVSAILPEVLRSGTRYEKFRTYLVQEGYNGDCDQLGRFDKWTDVDVFSSLIIKSADTNLWQRNIKSDSKSTVGDYFQVNVGPVVLYRSQNKGQWHRFICAKSTPRWIDDFQPKSSRRFTGKLFKPPFVTVRRTSSPSDKNRAVATVVTGKEAIAVENHLLVLSPFDRSLNRCRDLMDQLKAEATNDYLNEIIRCRHLTTGAVSSIPYRSWDG